MGKMSKNRQFVTGGEIYLLHSNNHKINKLQDAVTGVTGVTGKTQHLRSRFFLFSFYEQL
jgi:hypothetical protein